MLPIQYQSRNASFVPLDTFVQRQWDELNLDSNGEWGGDTERREGRKKNCAAASETKSNT